jgi:hypothetical protein
VRTGPACKCRVRPHRRSRPLNHLGPAELIVEEISLVLVRARTFLPSLDHQPSVHPVAWANLVPLTSRKYQNLIAVESYRMTLHQIGDCRRSVAGRLTSPVGLPLRPRPEAGSTHSVRDVGTVFFSPTERRGWAFYSRPIRQPSIRYRSVSPNSVFNAANCLSSLASS